MLKLELLALFLFMAASLSSGSFLAALSLIIFLVLPLAPRHQGEVARQAAGGQALGTMEEVVLLHRLPPTPALRGGRQLLSSIQPLGTGLQGGQVKHCFTISIW